MRRMYHDGWKDIDNPTGFANSTCGDLFIRFLIVIMGIGIVALIVLLK
jgi:hypothetical protein